MHVDQKYDPALPIEAGRLCCTVWGLAPTVCGYEYGVPSACLLVDIPRYNKVSWSYLVMQVALSPYRVGAKEIYNRVKHIEGAQVLASMARDPSARLPKALVQVHACLAALVENSS